MCEKKTPSCVCGIGIPGRRLTRHSKETYSLTPRGGFFDGRNQNRDPEPSAKTFHDSDRREPPNSRGMDVGDSPTNGTFGPLHSGPGGTVRRHLGFLKIESQ